MMLRFIVSAILIFVCFAAMAEARRTQKEILNMIFERAKVRYKYLKVVPKLIPRGYVVDYCKDLRMSSQMCGAYTGKYMGATCQNNITNGFSCDCPTGFTGKMCEEDLDECKTGTSKCAKSEYCRNIVFKENSIHRFDEGYFCVCPEGTTGKYCQINLMKENDYECPVSDVPILSQTTRDLEHFNRVDYYDLGTSDTTFRKQYAHILREARKVKAAAEAKGHPVVFPTLTRLRLNVWPYPMWPKLTDQEFSEARASPLRPDIENVAGIPIDSAKGYTYKYTMVRKNKYFFLPVPEVHFDKGYLISSIVIRPGLETFDGDYIPAGWSEVGGRLVTKFRLMTLGGNNTWQWYTDSNGDPMVFNTIGVALKQQLEKHHRIDSSITYSVPLPQRVAAGGVRIVADDWLPRRSGYDLNAKCFKEVQCVANGEGQRFFYFHPYLSANGQYDPMIRFEVVGCPA